MKRLTIPTFAERFLDRSLSSSVFTWREILDLIVPGVLDSLSIMLCNMLITALISKNGESSVAAVSLVGPITWLIICVFNGISAGGTVIIAQCSGRRDPLMLSHAIGMTLWMTVGFGVIVCLPLLIAPEGILQLLYPEADPIVMEKAVIYLSGCAWSVLVFTVYTAIFAVLRGLGESRRCLVLSVIINVAYLVFSILFLNILRLDIQGSVLALFLARFLGALSAVAALFLWKPPVKWAPKELLCYDRTLFRSCMHISIPLGLEQICSSLGNIVSRMYMIPLGTTVLATQAIVNSLMGVLQSPASSAGALAVTVVGRCIGAEDDDDARRYGRRCNQIALILLVGFGMLFYPLLPWLLKQYGPTPQVYALVNQILYWSIPAMLLFWPASTILAQTLRAANDAVFPTVISLAVLWCVNIGLGYLLAIPMGLGIWGIWIATWASWAVRCLVFSLRFCRKK